MKIQNYKDIIAWQKSHELTLKVYSITKTFPDTERYGLISQMQRSSVSVPSNIVEGFSRKGVKESIQFYYIAKASLKELDSQLLLSRDLDLISDTVYNEVALLCEETSKVLSGWINNSKSFDSEFIKN